MRFAPPVAVRPDPAPPNLLIECDPGPTFPEHDAQLRDWRPLLEQATFAAAVCASRHRELARWAEQVTRPGGR